MKKIEYLHRIWEWNENRNNETDKCKKINIFCTHIWKEKRKIKNRPWKNESASQAKRAMNKPYKKYFISSSQYIRSDSFIFFYIPINLAFVPFMVDFLHEVAAVAMWKRKNAISSDFSSIAHILSSSFFFFFFFLLLLLLQSMEKIRTCTIKKKNDRKKERHT